MQERWINARKLRDVYEEMAETARGHESTIKYAEVLDDLWQDLDMYAVDEDSITHMHGIWNVSWDRTTCSVCGWWIKGDYSEWYFCPCCGAKTDMYTRPEPNAFEPPVRGEWVKSDKEGFVVCSVCGDAYKTKKKEPGDYRGRCPICHAVMED